MQNAEEAIFSKISKCGFFQHGTHAPIFTNLDTSSSVIIPCLKMYVISLSSRTFSPFSFSSLLLSSSSPTLHFLEVMLFFSILDFLQERCQKSFFSHFTTIHSSLALGWPACCSFCEYINLIHTDGVERWRGGPAWALAPGWPGSRSG